MVDADLSATGSGQVLRPEKIEDSVQVRICGSEYNDDWKHSFYTPVVFGPSMTILVSASISGLLLLAMAKPHGCPTGLSVLAERS
jgi:hypothetical protein